MPNDTEIVQRAKMALAQTKKVEREARIAKQMSAGLLELLQQGNPAQGERNGSTNDSSQSN